MSIAVPALSVRQPWAELILSGKKTVELRTYDTRYRGEIWLHTGQHYDVDAMNRFGYEELFTGGYVGKVTLEMVLPLDHERWNKWEQRHLADGGYCPGFYGWILTNPHRFLNAVNGPGQLKLFWPDEHIVELLNRA